LSAQFGPGMKLELTDHEHPLLKIKLWRQLTADSAPETIALMAIVRTGRWQPRPPAVTMRERSPDAVAKPAKVGLPRHPPFRRRSVPPCRFMLVHRLALLALGRPRMDGVGRL
jgi:hypothetical protein